MTCHRAGLKAGSFRTRLRRLQRSEGEKRFGAVELDNPRDNAPEALPIELIQAFCLQVFSEGSSGWPIEPLKLVRLPFRHFRVRGLIETCRPERLLPCRTARLGSPFVLFQT